MRIFSPKYHKKSIASTVFFVVLAAVLFFVGLNLADLISSLVTRKASLFYGEVIRIPNSVLYAVTTKQTQNEQEAAAAAVSVKNMGGAGYVIKSGDYFVCAALYSSFKDAESVQAKIENSGIYNINIPLINFEFRGDSANIVSALNSFKGAYNALYAVSLDFDGGNISITIARERVAAAAATMRERYTSISKIKNDNAAKIAESLIFVISTLDALGGNNGGGLTLNSAIKYTYFEIIMENVSLAKKL